jgi:hypothetical protein
LIGAWARCKNEAWGKLIKATDKMIARRADTRARADFATWTMMAKLNGASSLSPEAQEFLARYRAYLADMTQAEATDATIALITKSYYAEMGGVGTPPVIPAGPHEAADDPVTDNVTAFRRPAAQRPKAGNTAGQAKPRLPVALIFACLVVVYVGIRYYLR